MSERAGQHENSEQRSIATNRAEQAPQGASLGELSRNEIRSLNERENSAMPKDFGSANNLTISGDLTSSDTNRGAGSGSNSGKPAGGMESQLRIPGNSEPSVTPGSSMKMPHSFAEGVKHLMNTVVPHQLEHRSVAGGTNAAMQAHQHPHESQHRKAK
jgi:hypothetical protein